jgi:AI-2 transport protein TqsA
MKLKKITNFSIILIGLFVLAIILKELTFIRPFIISIILTFMFMPIIRWSKQKRIHFSIPLFGILALILLIFAGIIGIIISEAQDLETYFSTQRASIRDQINEFNEISVFGLTTLNLDNYVDTDNLARSIFTLGGRLVSGIGVLITEIFFIILFTVFLVPSHKIILHNIEKNMSTSSIKSFRRTIIKIEESILNYLGTKLLISLATALTSAVVLYIYNTRFIFVLALIIFLLNFIPNIGSIIAVCCAIFIQFLNYGLNIHLVWFSLILFFIQLLFGNFIEPKFAGNRLKLAPIMIILSLFLWYYIWGVIGMLIAIPLTSIIKIILEQSKHTKLITSLME